MRPHFCSASSFLLERSLSLIIFVPLYPLTFIQVREIRKPCLSISVLYSTSVFLPYEPINQLPLTQFFRMVFSMACKSKPTPNWYWNFWLIIHSLGSWNFSNFHGEISSRKYCPHKFMDDDSCAPETRHLSSYQRLSKALVEYLLIPAIILSWRSYLDLKLQRPTFPR